jgi:hypothetical protein
MDKDNYPLHHEPVSHVLQSIEILGKNETMLNDSNIYYISMEFFTFNQSQWWNQFQLIKKESGRRLIGLILS